MNRTACLTLACLAALKAFSQTTPELAPLASRITEFASSSPVDVPATALPNLESAFFQTREEQTDLFVTAIRLRSAQARSLRLRVEGMHLPPESALWIYGDEGADLRGPFTGTGPMPDDFWLPAVQGGLITIEIISREPINGIPLKLAEIEAVSEEFLEQSRQEWEASRNTPTSEAEPGPVRWAQYRDRVFAYKVEEGLAVAEGDIILGPAAEIERDSALGLKDASPQAFGITITAYRWPGGVVPYVLGSGVNTATVNAAISHWNTILSGTIRLTPRTNQTSYVTFTNSSKCSSYVGRIGGNQPIYVSSACTTGNVIHEIGHAVGLYHEHTSTNRDTYLTILWANVNPTYAYNFAMQYGGTSYSAFDYGSIMHYGNYAFSVNGQPTIETKPPGIPIGQRVALSASDISGVRAMYGGSAPPPPPPPSVSTQIDSNPTDGRVTVDGVTVTGTATYSWPSGSSHTLAAATVYITPTHRLKFSQWSNLGPATQTFIVPSTASTLTASFARQYEVHATAGTGGSVTQTPAASDYFYASGSSVRMIATPASGRCFANWTGLATGTPNDTTVTVTGSLLPVANFLTGAITVSPASISVSSGVQSRILFVTASTGCTWQVTADAAWLHPLKVSGAVYVVIDANSGASSRIGRLTIGSSVVTITQSGT